MYVYDEDETRIAEGYTNVRNVSSGETVKWSMTILEDAPVWLEDYYFDIEISYW